MDSSNPYAPPAPAEPPGSPTGRKKKKRGSYRARFDGAALVVSRDATLPAVCLKCAGHEEIVRRTVKLRWTPVWTRFLVICGIGLLVRLITTKRATLEVALCVPCNARWDQARNASFACVAALVGSLLWVDFGRSGEHEGLALGLLGFVLVAFVLVSRLFVRPRVVRATRIDDDELTLAGFAPRAGQEIVDASR